jgi:GT2 family glycosyltransferase
MLNLTVVICTHNRADLLILAIDSIYSARVPQNCTVGILVVANACTDDTLRKVSDYQNQHNTNSYFNINVAEEPKPGKSYALNHAIRIVKSDYLCFMDDDQRLDKSYFIAVSKAIADFSEVTMLCGPLYPDWQGNEPDWIRDTGKYRITSLPIPEFNLGIESLDIEKMNQMPPGGQVVIRRDVFDRVGLFAENLGPIGHNLVGSEDTDFFIRAIEKGEIFRYFPDIVQYHYIDPARLKLSYLVQNSFQRNRSLTSITRKSERIPRYLWSKLIKYFLLSLSSFETKKFRHYLIRTASIMGQIAGYFNVSRT